MSSIVPPWGQNNNVWLGTSKYVIVEIALQTQKKLLQTVNSILSANDDSSIQLQLKINRQYAQPKTEKYISIETLKECSHRQKQRLGVACRRASSAGGHSKSKLRHITDKPKVKTSADYQSNFLSQSCTSEARGSSSRWSWQKVLVLNMTAQTGMKTVKLRSSASNSIALSQLHPAISTTAKKSQQNIRSQ